MNLLNFKALLSIADDLLQRLGGGTLSPKVEILAHYAGGNPRTFEALLVAGCHCLSPDRAEQVLQQEATASTLHNGAEPSAEAGEALLPQILHDVA